MIIMENMVIKLSNISQTITIIIIQLSQNGVTKNGKIGHNPQQLPAAARCDRRHLPLCPDHPGTAGRCGEDSLMTDQQGK
jgi:hypothetical protein